MQPSGLSLGTGGRRVQNQRSIEEASMSQSDTVRARVRLIDERLARLRAERDRLVARANHAERRRETRRKIVIGGTVLAAIDHEGVPPLRTRAELLHWLDLQLQRPHDRVVFDLTPRASARSEERRVGKEG